MKNQYIIIIFCSLCTLFATGCQENERTAYLESPAVYFSDLSETDSLVYSFAGVIGETDTIRIPIQLLGNFLEKPMSYKVVLDRANTSAQEGIHYEKLQDSYRFPANQPETDLPLVIYNKDTLLLKEYRSICFRIEGTDELQPGYSDRTYARVLITNQLIAPSYWNSLLKTYFGDYSRVKHNIAIHIMGHDFPATLDEASGNDYGYQYWMVMGRAVCKYFIDNIVYDENNERIYPWSPF